MREPRKRQQAAAAARNNVAPVERSTNLMGMPLNEFQGALSELAQQGVDTDALLRQYRAANSPVEGMSKAIFGTGFNSGAEASSAELAAAGRRPVFGGLLSKPAGDTGMDALRGLEFNLGGGLLGMLAGAGQAVDAPMAAYQGLIPQPDTAFEALGTASLATLGGGAVTRPAGSFGMGGRVAGETKPQRIARLLREGRQSEVTDDLLGSLTPDENAALFRLYDEGATGMDLPMDAASRLARAGEMGFGGDMYHGSNADFAAFNPNAFDVTGQKVMAHGAGTYLGETPRMAARYASRRDGGVIYPVRENMQNPWTGEMSVSNLSPDDLATYMGAESGPEALGFSGRRNSLGMSVVPNPANIRSRFARFDPRLTANANLLAANASPEAGLLSAAAARTPAEQMARQILDMRAAGRAGDVTDEMMAAADPQYMFANTPLPMDEASRMARAGEMGFDTSRPYLHGTAADFPAFRGDVWASEGTELPREYSSARMHMTGGDETTYPLAMRAGNSFEADKLPRTITVGDFANEVLEQSPVMANGNFDADGLSGRIDAIRAAARQEESGPHYGRHNFWNYPSELFGSKGADEISGLMDDLNFDSYRMTEGGERTLGVRRPNDARSRFARFDPEFAHLSNLNAANIDPLSGLFGAMAAEEQRRQRNAP